MRHNVSHILVYWNKQQSHKSLGRKANTMKLQPGNTFTWASAWRPAKTQNNKGRKWRL